MVSRTNLSVLFPGEMYLADDGGGSIFALRLGTSISSRLVTRLPSFNGGGQRHFSSRGLALVPVPPDVDFDCCAAIDIAPLGALKTSSVPATPSHRIAWRSNF